MTPPLPHGATRILRRELLAALDELEARYVQDGVVPDARRVATRRLRLPLEFTGALALGVFVAVFSVLCNFILFTMILHL